MKPTGAANIDVIKGFYHALAQGDWRYARSLLDPQIEWIEVVPEEIWFAGRHYGPDAVFKDIIDPARDKISRFHVKMRKYFAVGELVVALGAFRGRSKRTELELNVPTAHIWTLENGKAVRFQGFHDVAEWQLALGLSSMQSRLMAA